MLFYVCNNHTDACAVSLGKDKSTGKFFQDLWLTIISFFVKYTSWRSSVCEERNECPARTRNFFFFVYFVLPLGFTHVYMCQCWFGVWIQGKYIKGLRRKRQRLSIQEGSAEQRDDPQTETNTNLQKCMSGRTPRKKSNLQKNFEVLTTECTRIVLLSLSLSLSYKC